MKHNTINAAGAAILLAVFAAPVAQAQPKAEPKLVSRDELRVCMNSEADLATRRKAIEERNKKNSEEANAIKAEAAELTEEQQRIGEDDASRLERFVNRKVKPHNVRVRAAQSNAEGLRADMESLNQGLIAHNGKCGGISFSKEDKDAILKERETAAK